MRPSRELLITKRRGDERGSAADEPGKLRNGKITSMSKKIGLRFLIILLLTLSLFSNAFTQTNQKSVVGILIDNTGSMRSQFELVKQLSKGIVERTPPGASIALFRFNSLGRSISETVAVVSPDVEWSESRNVILQNIEGIYVLGGQTKLKDSIKVMADQVNTRAKTDNAEGKIIFLITDGEDRSSKIGEQELIKFLKESGIKVYAIGLVNELFDEGALVRSAKQKATSFLNHLTKETGGRVVYPKKKQVDGGVLLEQLFAK